MQTVSLALFRVKLTGEQVVAMNHGAELAAVIARQSDNRRVSRFNVIRMDEIKTGLGFNPL